MAGSPRRGSLPQGEALDEVHNNYVDMAIAGRVTDAQRRVFSRSGSSCAGAGRRGGHARRHRSVSGVRGPGLRIP